MFGEKSNNANQEESRLLFGCCIFFFVAFVFIWSVGFVVDFALLTFKCHFKMKSSLQPNIYLVLLIGVPNDIWYLLFDEIRFYECKKKIERERIEKKTFKSTAVSVCQMKRNAKLTFKSCVCFCLFFLFLFPCEMGTLRMINESG